MKKIIPLVVVVLGLTLYVYFWRIRPAREHDPTVRGSGTIEATTVVISAKLPARILTLTKSEGDKVSVGEVLATLQCDEPQARLAQAEAALAQAHALRAQAKAAEAQARAQGAPLRTQEKLAVKERDRALSLFNSAGATQRTVDQAETALVTVGEQARAVALTAEVAAKNVRVAEAQVVVAEKSLELAKTQVNECTLLAPMSGVVLARNHEPGELVLPGSSLLKLGQLDEVHTWIYVPNEEVGQVKLGGGAVLEADTYPERVFKGKVSRINQEAEFTPKSIQTKEDRTRLVFGVKVTIANDDGALLPGMPVEATLTGAPEPTPNTR